MPEKRKINPQIASLEIGTRNLRTIKIYPLSFGDQLEMTDLITETIQKFLEARNDNMYKLEKKLKELKEKILSTEETKNFDEKSIDYLKEKESFENELKELKGKENLKFIQFVIDLFKKNLIRLIKLISDKNEDLLKELTNNQALEIVTLIYKMNYEESLKNGLSLFEEIKILLQQKGQSPQSVKDIPTD